MKLLARIALATVVEAQLEFFVPSDNGYSGINEAATGCAEENGEITNVNQPGLRAFIDADKSLSRQKVLILADGTADATWIFTNDLSTPAKSRKTSRTICQREAVERNTCTGSGDSTLYPDDYVFYPSMTANTVGFEDARLQCQQLGANWDLAVIDNDQEYDFINGVVQSECWSEQAFWIGFYEYNTIDNGDGSHTAGDIKTVFGRTPDWEVKFSTEFGGEPNDNMGVEECLRMKDGVVNDAVCTQTYTGAPKNNIGMGFVCEQTTNTDSECTVNQAAEPLVDDEYVIRYDEAINWGDARKECKAIGKHWDLAIFNHQREYERITEIISDHCLDDFAYWVGYRENKGVGRTIFDQELLLKQDGFTTSIPLPWDITSNMAAPEPNDWLGSEECVRMRGGEMNDALCSRTWTGGKKQGNGMGFICERHNPCEDRRSGTSFTGYTGTDYIIAEPEYISANDAKIACKNHGDGWDLVVIDDALELKEINNKITDGCAAFWTGMTEKGGKTYDLDRQTEVQFSSWDDHLGHGFNTNPGTPYTNTFDCIRMRGGMYNDADCTKAHGFTKHEKMGYVCEYKTPIPEPTDAPNTGDDQCLPCTHNPGVLPWVTQRGCAEPNCGARLGVVDAWKIGNGINRPVRYGFIGLIKLPKEVIDSGEEFSVLLRFSKRVTHGHFQLWNMQFWNFYNGGYEVLIHSKYWNTDRHDKYSVGFVAEELNAEEYPELLFWTGRQKQHQCFQPSMHHGQMRGGTKKTLFEQAVMNKPHVNQEDITSVKFKNGAISYIRGNKASKKIKTGNL